MVPARNAEHGTAAAEQLTMTNPRRSLLRLGAVSALAIGLGAGSWRRALAGLAVAGLSPYGPLGPANALGVALPAGFTARLLASTGEIVAGTSYRWHGEPDGAATFPAPRGGWYYVSNSELNGTRGGVGVLRFNAAGSVDAAYAILSGTKWNCSGGATPWGTWLSCEEHRAGLVWECDPSGPGQGVARPLLGKFPHEAAVVDPLSSYVYLTEDDSGSRFYRFCPERWGDLTAGTLEAAAWQADGTVSWIAVKTDRPDRSRTTTGFERGEGAWFSAGIVYFCTTADNRVWAYDVNSRRLEIIYDAALIGPGAPLREPDNITVHARSGDIYCAEDDDDLQLVLLADAAGQRIAAPFMQLFGHEGSEVAGPAFSPDGSRLYVSSQRGRDGSNGMTFEITGPFRGRR
jgi:secreted PhoX family phosphatase